eukprot:TRINITY_DN27890_c0_g1_i1.p1 TRINITY_DN27890_c0_g1~~TRINITY_DN27890_c0_g1_i1.p1  ORF type:complete len:318 (-),score=60.15 TRINITY_DN27890_c0_g1_i1:175-1044(-)
MTDMVDVGTQLRSWEFEDVELQYEKSRRRNQWKFLNSVKADNLYQKEALNDYLSWSEYQGHAEYFEPLPTYGHESRSKEDESCEATGKTEASPAEADLPTLPNAVVHQIIGEYAEMVVDKGSAKEKEKFKPEHDDPLSLPTEVVNQIVGEYAEKVVDKGSKKHKKNKKGKQASACVKEGEILPEEKQVSAWENNLRILMSEFSMPREKAEKVMNQAKGEPYEAVRIVGGEVKATMESLANLISKKDAIQLHVQAGWSASEVRKAKQQWLAKAGIPRDVQRMVLAGKIAK